MGKPVWSLMCPTPVRETTRLATPSLNVRRLTMVDLSVATVQLAMRVPVSMAVRILTSVQPTPAPVMRWLSAPTPTVASPVATAPKASRVVATAGVWTLTSVRRTTAAAMR